MSRKNGAGKNSILFYSYILVNLYHIYSILLGHFSKLLKIF